MDLAVATFTVLVGFVLLRLPRQWAALPLLVGASYMTLGQSIEVGPFHLTALRVLVAVGALRVIVRGERLTGGLNQLDRIVILWALWAVCSSMFHKNFSAALTLRLGMACEALGLYFLLRIFIQDGEGILSLFKLVIILLIPIALEMISESITGRNSFAIFGGVDEVCEVRKGHIRAQGPFAHSILAGTVGAICLPMALLFWKKNRQLALTGLLVTGAMVVTSRSSGPIMTAFVVFLGLALWWVREHLRLIRWGAVLAVIGLNAVMNAPVYYLLARIDLAGGSTSWHRAALIEAALDHFGEWWVVGTDYTRHWMAYGVAWSEDHCDMTNYYIKMGVLGGLPLMLLLIALLVSGFKTLGKALRSNAAEPIETQFVLWTLGAMLFGHAATMMSVSYFDQSVIFLYLVLAAIGSVQLVRPNCVFLTEEAPVLQTAGDESPFCNHC